MVRFTVWRLHQEALFKQKIVVIFIFAKINFILFPCHFKNHNNKRTANTTTVLTQVRKIAIDSYSACMKPEN